MKFLPAVAFAAIATTAHAQAVPNPATFIAFATQVTNNIDQQRAGLVWDRASDMLKGRIPKDRFVAQILDRQQRNGATVSREWQSIIRTTVTISDQPLVQRPMVTVTFLVTTNKRISYNEVIQFTIGQDNLWHTASYLN
jgi:Protein of unknown function (DUF4019)